MEEFTVKRYYAGRIITDLSETLNRQGTERN
jgi:hypothetical protein